MTLEEWQIALRNLQASKEPLSIAEKGKESDPGAYHVVNLKTKKEYKVVFRGEGSDWNYCSCMDFKTSNLGTCKHIEGVMQWHQKRRRRPNTTLPPYSSMYLSYKGERTVRLRIGTDNAEEFAQLASPYFTPSGSLRNEALNTINIFLQQAVELNNTFRCYPDALDFIVEQRAKANRAATVDTIASDAVLGSLLKTTLYPYQKEGIRFAFKAGKSIIADEMGLGKTIQAIGTAEL